MTSRRVTSSSVPYLPVTVEIPEQRLSAEFTALVDTGFNADAVVPESSIDGSVISLLQTDVRLADGSRITLPAYLGNVRIGTTTVGPVLLLAMGDEAIVGLNVITRFRLMIDHDQQLTIEP